MFTLVQVDLSRPVSGRLSHCCSVRIVICKGLCGRLVDARIPGLFLSCLLNVSVSCGDEAGEESSWANNLWHEPYGCVQRLNPSDFFQYASFFLCSFHHPSFDTAFWRYLGVSEFSSSSMADSSRFFCPCRIPVQPECCSHSAAQPSLGGHWHCVCVNNKYQWINTIKGHKPHRVLHLLPSSQYFCQVLFMSLYLVCQNRLLPYNWLEEHQTSWLLACPTCCSVTVMWHSTNHKQFMHLCFQLSLHRHQTKVTEFRGSSVRGSVENLRPPSWFRHSLRSLAGPEVTFYLH